MQAASTEAARLMGMASGQFRRTESILLSRGRRQHACVSDLAPRHRMVTMLD